MLQASMRFVPFRFVTRVVHPTDNGGFIAPLQQPPHHFCVRPGQHKRLHRVFRRPERPSPINIATFAQERYTYIAIGLLSLLMNAHGVIKEWQNVSR